MKSERKIRIRPSLSKRERGLCLSLLIIIELVVGVILWNRSQPIPTQGFVVKNGASYILLWKRDDQSTEVRRFSYLPELLDFAGEELGLQIGPNPSVQVNVDNLWARDDMGKRILFWQTENASFLNRLTFRRPYEGEIYEKAFRAGAYSPSPFGHSISLVRKAH